jgi:hypothetical protein
VTVAPGTEEQLHIYQPALVVEVVQEILGLGSGEQDQ